ncbi:hypothetical protein PGB28_04090 [Primorskyibacter aestuariivivens]|uniref:hypothetical protein n=1 Tax=Primorskyibacter aestuariivivens TaxID=1888912 RepID=UPI002301F3F0|nr:hypothetical protein [Primorskyibacter aestuariivivens]MDA7427627.1 hypothetical protein [Primorskyibacter aestuariivivens]
MNQDSRGLFSSPDSIPAVFVTSLILYAAFQYILAPQFLQSFTPRGPDDALRLLSVRDLLAGQGWFDNVQYRILPPEGLDLHWSRLIDGILAVGTLIARPFVGDILAERLIAALWPALLFTAFLGLTALAAYRARGASAAAFAMLAAALLPAIAVTHFALGRVDHHNAQIVCMIGIVASLLADTQHRRAGLAGGVFAALSLSIGLEMLPFIGICVMLLVTRFLRGTYGARERMLGFGLSFGAISALLFPIEVPYADWRALECDRFALPALTLALGTLVFVFLASALARNATGLFRRFVFAVIAACIVGALLYPVLSPCLAGPFANLSEDVRSGIVANMLENTAARDLILNDPRSAISHYLPFLLVLPFLMFGPKDDGEDLVLVFVILGLIGAVFQLRAMIWGVVVLPLAYGLVAERILNRPWRKFLRLFKPFLFLGFTAVFIYPPLVYIWNDLLPPSTRAPQDHRCKAPESLRAVGEVPRGLALTPLGLSVHLIYHTRHSVTSAPYHTHPDAHANGMKYHSGTPEEMIAGIETLGAEFVVVCSGSRYGDPDSAGSRLAQGEVFGGLTEFTLPDSNLRVYFKVAEPPVLESDRMDSPETNAATPPETAPPVTNEPAVKTPLTPVTNEPEAEQVPVPAPSSEDVTNQPGDG